MIQTAAFLAPCLRVVGLPQVGCATQHCESKRFATSKCTVLLMIRRYFWKSMRTRERLHQIVWCYVISIWVLLTCFKWRHMLFIATSWWHTLSSSLYPKAQEAVEEVRLRGCFAWSRRDLQEVAAGARRDWTRGHLRWVVWNCQVKKGKGELCGATGLYMARKLNKTAGENWGNPLQDLNI